MNGDNSIYNLPDNCESKAEQASRAKTEFLSNMSHELRTPLNVMIGMCDVAKYHIDDKERVIDCLKKISKAGDCLTKLLDSVLDISRIEQGKMVFRDEPFTIDELEEEVKILMSPLAMEKSIIFSIISKDMINRNIRGDYRHILQVMTNLITNSIKYTSRGGFVQLIIEELENNSKDTVTCKFTCIDNGVGMSKEYIEHIFEPFSRGENVAGNKSGGTGLGMAIVKSIVDEVKGSIHIDSEENVGTSVEVTIDFKSSDVKKEVFDLEKYKKEKENNIKSKKIVLVAEDRAENMEVIKALLEDLDYDVDCAENGEDVVDMYIASEEGYYKAVFMDIKMPVMDGYQATMMIRAMNRSDANIPVIAMSAKAYTDDKNLAVEAGMDKYITKPLKRDKVNDVLQNIMKNG